MWAAGEGGGVGQCGLAGFVWAAVNLCEYGHFGTNQIEKRVPTRRRACQGVGGIFARSAFDSKVFLNFFILLAVGKARQILMDDPLDMVLLLNCAGRRKFMYCFGALLMSF